MKIYIKQTIIHNGHLPIPLNIEKPNVYVRQFKPAIEMFYKEYFGKSIIAVIESTIFFVRKT